MEMQTMKYNSTKQIQFSSINHPKYQNTPNTNSEHIKTAGNTEETKEQENVVLTSYLPGKLEAKLKGPIEEQRKKVRNHIKTHESNQWTADLGYPFELVETPEETWDSSVKIFKWVF